MHEGRIKPNIHRSADVPTFARLQEYVLEEGDLIFSRRGELGRCALVRKREAGWLLGTGSMRVRLGSSTMNREYLITSFQAPFVAEFLSALSIGATMESLNTSIVKRLPVIIPPTDEQRSIADFLN